MAYFGPGDEYVVCGSDSGHVWIWDVTTQNPVELLQADSNICNGVVPHPHLPWLASYGIDDVAKVWVPGGEVCVGVCVCVRVCARVCACVDDVAKLPECACALSLFLSLSVTHTRTHAYTHTRIHAHS